jgi:hypothetical protein
MIRTYLTLIYFGFYLMRDNFGALHDKVRSYPVSKPPASDNTIQKVCAAVDIACIWYRKEVLCLQRSATTACLLKRYGVPARMLIGAQQVPFRAHAWVEVDGRVVNDKPYMREMYAVLDHC